MKTLGLSVLGSMFLSVALASSVFAAQEVTVLYSNATFSGTALFVTKDAGLCRRKGIDLKLVLGGGSAPTVSALVGGHAQFIQVSASSLLHAALKGSPIVIVAKVMGPPPYKLVGKKSIKSVRDLKGKKVGVNKFGGAPDFLLRYVLAKNIPDSRKSVAILQTGNPAERLAALLSGGVDATMLIVPEDKVAEQKGYHVILDFSRLKFPYVNIVLGTDEGFAKRNPGLVKAFLGCYWEGLKKAKTDPRFAEKTLAHWTRSKDASLIDYTYESWRRAYAPRSLKVESKELDLLLKSATKSGHAGNASRFLDMRYLP